MVELVPPPSMVRLGVGGGSTSVGVNNLDPLRSARVALVVDHGSDLRLDREARLELAPGGAGQCTLALSPATPTSGRKRISVEARLLGPDTRLASTELLVHIPFPVGAVVRPALVGAGVVGAFVGVGPIAATIFSSATTVTENAEKISGFTLCAILGGIFLILQLTNTESFFKWIAGFFGVLGLIQLGWPFIGALDLGAGAALLRGAGLNEAPSLVMVAVAATAVGGMLGGGAGASHGLKDVSRGGAALATGAVMVAVLGLLLARGAGRCSTSRDCRTGLCVMWQCQTSRLSAGGTCELDRDCNGECVNGACVDLRPQESGRVESTPAKDLSPGKSPTSAKAPSQPGIGGAARAPTKEPAKANCASFADCSAACDGGSAPACHAAAAMSYAGTGSATKDDARAYGLFTKACDGGELRACVQQGNLEQQGNGTAKNGPKALESFLKGCTDDETLGCFGAGVILLGGQGVPKDVERAYPLFERGCASGFKPACKNRDMLAPSVRGKTAPASTSSTCVKPEPWDGRTRGWDRYGSRLCSAPGVKIGYFLRVSRGEEKSTSVDAAANAWREYAQTHLGRGACAKASEEAYFDPDGAGHGYGLLFAAKPPGWDALLGEHPEWRLLGAGDTAIVTPVCFFPTDDGRRASGW